MSLLQYDARYLQSQNRNDNFGSILSTIDFFNLHWERKWSKEERLKNSNKRVILAQLATDGLNLQYTRMIWFSHKVEFYTNNQTIIV